MAAGGGGPTPRRRPGRRAGGGTAAGTRAVAEAADRPAIVFLHGTRLSGAQWAAQVADLGDEFRCLTPDLPGHGAAAATPFTLAGAAESVERLIVEEAGGRAFVVGLSLGGYVAMELAARSPALVRGLVLAGATAEPDGVRSLAYRGLAAIFATIDEALLVRLNGWFFRLRYRPAIAEPIVAGGFHFRGGAVAVRSLAGERFRPRLARYPGPTLLVNGELDVFFRLFARSFQDTAADARRIVLPRATHLTNLDRPELFSAAVRRFVRGVVASAQ
jgi:pimeloyl-ACP methyl ester carboxylesterase